jgi:hypothetical protein
MSIILIRHGEKPEDSKNIHLSEDGVIRAKELHNYFKHVNRIPNMIIAMKQHKDHSVRPYETIMHLARKIGIDIINYYERDQIDELILLLSNHKDKDILVSWEHHRLVDIIEKLVDIRIEWGSEDYTSVYIIKDKNLSKIREFDVIKHVVDYTNATI